MIILTSSSDSFAHAVTVSHEFMNPYVTAPSSPNISTFSFDDLWGDTIGINRITIDGKILPTPFDSSIRLYNINLSTNVESLTFYFNTYEPYTFINATKVNKNYSIGLQPKYSSNFFRNDTFKLTPKKFVDFKRKMEYRR